MASSITSKIPREIQEELKRRELLSSRAAKSIYVPGAGQNAVFADYASKTHYTIMSTNLADSTKNKAISAGEIKVSNGNLINMSWGFKGSGNGAYRNTELGSATGIRPVAGIKSITSEFTGDNQSYIRQTDVNWVAPSLESLEEFGAFLTIGENIVVQWGNVGAKTTLDNNESFIVLYDDRITINQDVQTNPQERIIRSNGNMDGVAGQVSNFSFKLRDDGGFDCVTELISLGGNVFSMDNRLGDIQGMSAVLPKDVESKLKQISDGLIPDKVINVIDDTIGQITETFSFLNPNSAQNVDNPKVTSTEDNLLNALLNLDNIVDAHMYGNGAIDIEFSDIGDNPISKTDIDANDNTKKMTITRKNENDDNYEAGTVSNISINGAVQFDAAATDASELKPGETRIVGYAPLEG